MSEYEIPEEPMSYWLDHFAGWLRRVSIDLDWRPWPVLQTIRQQVMTRLEEVALLKEREMKREKKIAHSDQNKTVDRNVHDSNAHERLDMLWRFASDQNERLITCEKQIERLQCVLKDVYRVLPAEYE